MMHEILNNLLWIEELLPPETESAPKQGGMAYYLDSKLMMILTEKPGSYEHKGISYPFELWHGCILPVEYKRQSAFFLKFSFLENHPASKDWLYIPADSEDFEDQIKQFMREIHRRNPLLGLTVKTRDLTASEKPKSKSSKKRSVQPAPSKKKENDLMLSILNKNKKY